MKQKMAEFFARRAEDLAFIHLTRRGDLVVNRLDAPDSGVDFLVTVTREGLPTGRIFGVQVEARDASVRGARELAALEPPLERSVTELPFPLCVFVFTMRDDRGYVTWLKAPAIGARRAALRAANGNDWSELDPAMIASIVRDVERWYDARGRGPQPTPSPSDRHPQAA